MEKPKNLKESKKKIDSYIRYSSLAFEMAAIMVIGTYLGHKIDGWLDLDFPAFTLGLLVLSVFAAIYHAIKNFLK